MTEALISTLAKIGALRVVSRTSVMRYNAGLGETHEAFRWLEIAYRQHAEWMLLLKVDPCFDKLRPDPRLQDLLRRMNFPSYI